LSPVGADPPPPGAENSRAGFNRFKLTSEKALTKPAQTTWCRRRGLAAQASRLWCRGLADREQQPHLGASPERVRFDGESGRDVREAGQDRHPDDGEHLSCVGDRSRGLGLVEVVPSVSSRSLDPARPPVLVPLAGPDGTPAERVALVEVGSLPPTITATVLHPSWRADRRSDLIDKPVGWAHLPSHAATALDCHDRPPDPLADHFVVGDLE
jgi:hypothetical protein